MKNVRNEVMIGLLALAAIGAAVVLAALHQPVPTYLPLIAVTGLGALAGTTLPANTTPLAPGALPADAAAIIDTLAGKLDNALTGMNTPPPAPDAEARAAAAKLTNDLARGLPLPTPEPATTPAAETSLATGTQ